MDINIIERSMNDLNEIEEDIAFTERRIEECKQNGNTAAMIEWEFHLKFIKKYSMVEAKSIIEVSTEKYLKYTIDTFDY